MGICTSCDAAGQPMSTAKVILRDGRLQEYSYPVKVSYVLERDPDTFLCNSDDMEFDDVVPAVDAADELQPGQIYFALPVNWLKRPIQPQEMAALAVKASAALVKTGKCRCRRNQVFFASAAAEIDLKSAAGKATRKARSVNGGGGRRRKVFTANLGAIAE